MAFQGRRQSTAAMFGLSGSMVRRSTTACSLVKQNEHSVLGASLGVRKSSRPDYLLADGSLPTPGEVDLDFHPTDLADLMILSRCVEPLRFTVGPDLLGYDVTVTSLTEAFKSHVEFLRQRALKTETSGTFENSTTTQVYEVDGFRGSPGPAHLDEDETPVLSPNSRANNANTTSGTIGNAHNNGNGSDSSVRSLRHALHKQGREAEQAILSDIDSVCKHVASLHSKELNVTFGELFDFEFPLFPETTEEDRVLLQELCANSEVVARADVERALNVSSASQVVEFIFSSGSEALPVEVFKDIVDCLGTHPKTISFAPDFVTKMAATGQGMQGLILHLITLIAVLFVCPRLVLSEHVA
eukprot:CAMPEP_0174871968 /NCGR_PEP_ID=MMETSP1114-20130205/72465_1 /TAXON_ID=312471 /ORGANISM="Neobodo designis, Strain CCAP 1951/1" /LENGTH=356 /DNA_ID=CAMNT_0016107261 /DNA_START=434 /DNA_END=1501 /DNA_ORIENTATION=-